MSAREYTKHSWAPEFWDLEQDIHVKTLQLKLLMPQLHEWTCLWNQVSYLCGTAKNIWVEFRGSRGLTLAGRGSNWLQLDCFYSWNSIYVPSGLPSLPTVRWKLDRDWQRQKQWCFTHLELVLMGCYQLMFVSPLKLRCWSLIPSVKAFGGGGMGGN